MEKVATEPMRTAQCARRFLCKGHASAILPKDQNGGPRSETSAIRNPAHHRDADTHDGAKERVFAFFFLTLLLKNCRV